jgi:hypothetical protein
MPKNAKTYECIKCNFICSKESNYKKHLLTRKHQMETSETEKMPTNTELYKCECGQVYKHRSGLWKHSKKCTFVGNSKEDKELVKSDETVDKINLEKTILDKDRQIDKLTKLVVEQQDENKSLSKMVVEQKEETHKILEEVRNNVGSKTINNINNVNTINMNYNVNVFLNDQCKDAINLLDFVNNVQCQLNDVENVGKIGYVDGISKIFIDKLSVMDVDKRPIHCTDLKRKSMYIKDNNEWKKDENNTEVKKAIGEITQKNIKTLDKWRILNMKSAHDSKQSQYLGMCNETFTPDDDGKQKEKILKNIGDAVPLDKGVIKTTIEEISMDEKIE